jgi:crotonobetainyl-CoA:carnitine CoA-transferase CaiB-like acyl-CoA transferase
VQAIFDGLRVLDLSNVLSGPTLTRLLTEMGAEVIKVELHPAGDIGRYLPWLRNGRSGYHVQQNRGKKSLFVDGKHPLGRELLLDLVEQVDVLVENFAPGAVGRLGLGWEVVSARNPRLVMCSISAFGQTGPLAGLPGYDPIAQAYTGTMHMVGERDGSPAMMAFSPGDVLTGVHGLAGVCAALYHRERTGQGQKVEVSLVDSYVTCHEINFQVTSASGGEFQPRRNGSVHPLIGGCGAFPVPDGHVAMAVLNDHQWAGLCAAMGDPELVHDPRFFSTEGRTANADEFNQLIRDWLMTQSGRDEVVEKLGAQRVPVAPVLSVEEALANPHLRANRTLRTVHDERLGPVDVPGMPIRFSGFPDELDLQASSLGAHNEEVVRGLLGKDAETYDRLVASGVLRQEPES